MNLSKIIHSDDWFREVSAIIIVIIYLQFSVKNSYAESKTIWNIKCDFLYAVLIKFKNLTLIFLKSWTIINSFALKRLSEDETSISGKKY